MKDHQEVVVVTTDTTDVADAIDVIEVNAEDMEEEIAEKENVGKEMMTLNLLKKAVIDIVEAIVQDHMSMIVIIDAVSVAKNAHSRSMEVGKNSSLARLVPLSMHALSLTHKDHLLFA